MSTPRLSETSYIVLGMLEHAQAATPYDLKQIAKLSTMNFWTVPHAQLYKECARLASEGLLSEQREEDGRRRRVYSLARRGREALEAWRNEPAGKHAEVRELRDEALLKIFLGADPAKIAPGQLEIHEQRLRKWQDMHEVAADSAPHGALLTLEAGIGHAREYVRFWKSVCASIPKNGTTRAPRKSRTPRKS
jgi:PadR family transcriptional regulator, regulatory protein AphA